MRRRASKTARGRRSERTTRDSGDDLLFEVTVEKDGIVTLAPRSPGKLKAQTPGNAMDDLQSVWRTARAHLLDAADPRMRVHWSLIVRIAEVAILQRFVPDSAVQDPGVPRLLGAALVLLNESRRGIGKRKIAVDEGRIRGNCLMVLDEASARWASAHLTKRHEILRDAATNLLALTGKDPPVEAVRSALDLWSLPWRWRPKDPKYVAITSVLKALGIAPDTSDAFRNTVRRYVTGTLG